MISNFLSRLLIRAHLLFTIVLTGCVDVEVAIKLNPDGSGTVTETVLVKSDIGIQANGKPVQLQAKPLDSPSLATKVNSYGGEVYLISNRALNRGGKVGYRAEFGFDDINKLKVPIDQKNPKNFYTFQQVKGNTNRLSILSTLDWLGDTNIEPKVEEALTDAIVNDPKFKNYLGTVFKNLQDASYKIHLELAGGKMIKSNAMYQQGQVINLINMDFNQMVHYPDFSEFLTMQNMGKKPTRYQLMSQRIPGMEVDFQKEISIEYQ